MDIRVFAALKDRDLRGEGLLVAEGRLLAERLLRSGWPVLGVLCAPRFAEFFGELAAGVCPVQVLPDQEMAAVAGYPFHRGVLAAARRPEFAPLESLLESAGEISTVVACPEIADAENLGGILRSAAAFGVDVLLLGPRSCDPWSRRALKAAMGASFSLPLAVCEDEALACRALHGAGYTVAAACLCLAAVPLAGYRRPRRLCLVLGNEAAGVGEPWASCSDLPLTIPMRGGTDSLNVGVAAGIFLHALQGG